MDKYVHISLLEIDEWKENAQISMIINYRLMLFNLYVLLLFTSPLTVDLMCLAWEPMLSSIVSGKNQTHHLPLSRIIET